MSKGNTAITAILRLVGLAVVLAVFCLAMVGVVYMSLQGTEVKVPELTGKTLTDSEHELASLGLKVKRRAERISAEPVDSVIEQLPKPGETVKTGQVIYVVTSKGGGTPADVPPTVNTDEDDSKKIEEMITDKPQKPKNANTKKKADTTRDVTNSNTASDSNSASTPDSNSKKDPNSNSAPPASNKQTPPANKQVKDEVKPKTPADTKPKPGAKPHQ